MKDFLRKIEELSEEKNSSNLNKKTTKQLRLIIKELRKEAVEKKVFKKIIRNIKETEAERVFALEQKELYKILREKDLETKLSSMYEEEIDSINETIQKLQEVLEEESRTGKFDTEKEKGLIDEIRRLEENISLKEDELKEYLSDLKEFTYDKRIYNKAKILIRIVRSTIVSLSIKGSENIPSKGGCILAPHHHNAFFDPMSIISATTRRVIFPASVETFIAVPLLEGFFYKMGCIPLKRDEKKHQERKENMIDYERVKDYASSNQRSLKKILKHLKHGEIIATFPEGDAKVLGTYKRLDDEKFIRADEGFIKLAYLMKRKYDMDIPIIPIGLRYEGKLGRNIIVNVGRPIHLEKTLFSKEGEELKQGIRRAADEIFEEIKRLSGS